MKNNPHSYDRNFYNCVKKPEKNPGLQQGLNPWPRNTGVTLYQLSYEGVLQIFHGNIWTQNWPAPNVSGFIAQLVERHTGIARSRVHAPLKSWIFLGLFTQL